MADRGNLTISYFETRPESAARALLATGAAESAAILQEIPPEVAARPVALLGAWPASTMLELMPPAAASALLGEIDDATAAAILRLLSPQVRQALLEHMPGRPRRYLEEALAYPPDTVGAHVTNSIVVLASDNKVSVALDAVREARSVATETIFVINHKSEPAGAVSAMTLLTSDAASTLADIADRSRPVLAARTGIAAIGAIDAWHDHDALAVVNRRGQMIGALTRRRLQQASGSGLRPVSADTSMAGSMSEAMISSAGGLLALLSGRRTGGSSAGDAGE